MFKIYGKHNSAVVFADSIEDNCAIQIKDMCNMEAYKNSKIRIMPDVHSGLGCTIGTTMTIDNKVSPFMVGVDIGCGMETLILGDKTLDLMNLDRIIRKLVPSGRAIRNTCHPYLDEIDLSLLRCKNFNLSRAHHSIGTLGGGNHFIEVAREDDGKLYLIVHSGSRHLGNEVAEYYQDMAWRQLGCVGKRENAYLQGDLLDDYLADMQIVQQFASLNRRAIINVIVSYIGLSSRGQFTTIHNYIDIKNKILRKGAVSAQAGERLLIPINMKDGSLICTGKGNADWNYSAPHGAGRALSRSKAHATLSLRQYHRIMKGVYSTCVGKETLDESPMAYKNMQDIVKHISPTVNIIKRIVPVYNFKAKE